MNACTKQSPSLRYRCVKFLFVIAGLVWLPFSAEAVNWTVVVRPAEGGVAPYSTINPFGGGDVTNGREVLRLRPETVLTISFFPRAGYRIERITRNGADITASGRPLGDGREYVFAEETQAQSLIATFTQETPTGEFSLGFPAEPNANLTSIFDVSGHYAGLFNLLRGFDADVAMDEQGKLDILLNSVAGLTFQSNRVRFGGFVRTRNRQPEATIMFSGSGSQAGEAVKISGTATGAIDLGDIGGGTNGVEGAANYVLTVGETRSRERGLPVAMPVPPEVVRAWSLKIKLETQATRRNRNQLVASAEIVLPNGNAVTFPKKRVRFSNRNGYLLGFSNGKVSGSNALDRTTRIQVKRLSFNREGTDFIISGGELTYAFLGQRGVGDILEFLAP